MNRQIPYLLGAILVGIAVWNLFEDQNKQYQQMVREHETTLQQNRYCEKSRYQPAYIALAYLEGAGLNVSSREANHVLALYQAGREEESQILGN